MTHPVRSAALALALLAAAGSAEAQRLAPTIPVEVFAGRMEFGSDLGLPDQELAGFRIGLDVASYAGLRAFYWRGINGDRDGWAPVQAYGGEAQLNLNAGNGLTPFLVGGLGRIDFMEGFVDTDSAAPVDRTAFIAGGGLRLDVGRVGLTGAARNFLFQRDAEAGDDLVSNIQLTAGVAFRLGRSGRRAAPADAPEVVRRTPDTVYVARPAAAGTDDDEDEPRSFVTIPIPKEGEIYLRYGPSDSSAIARRPSIDGPAPTSEADIEALRLRLLADLRPVLRALLEEERAEIREMIRDELDRLPAAALTPEAEQRLLENLEVRLALRLREGLARGVVVDSTGAVIAAPGLAEEEDDGGFAPRFAGWRGYVGGNVDAPRQFVMGGRVDLGPLDPARPRLRIVPEAAIAFGRGTNSVLIAGYAQYEFDALNVRGIPLQPYAYTGPGVLFFGDPPRGSAKTEAVLNLGWGVVTPLAGDGPRFFLEHQGVDLFDLNRVLVGLAF